ncbi:MAG: hypothetical protein WD579_02475 [Candidatus Paceibacterota bacterium]
MTKQKYELPVSKDGTAQSTQTLRHFFNSLETVEEQVDMVTSWFVSSVKAGDDDTSLWNLQRLIDLFEYHPRKQNSKDAQEFFLPEEAFISFFVEYFPDVVEVRTKPTVVTPPKRLEQTTERMLNHLAECWSDRDEERMILVVCLLQHAAYPSPSRKTRCEHDLYAQFREDYPSGNVFVPSGIVSTVNNALERIAKGMNRNILHDWVEEDIPFDPAGKFAEVAREFAFDLWGRETFEETESSLCWPDIDPAKINPVVGDFILLYLRGYIFQMNDFIEGNFGSDTGEKIQFRVNDSWVWVEHVSIEYDTLVLTLNKQEEESVSITDILYKFANGLKEEWSASWFPLALRRVCIKYPDHDWVLEMEVRTEIVK